MDRGKAGVPTYGVAFAGQRRGAFSWCGRKDVVDTGQGEEVAIFTKVAKPGRKLGHWRSASGAREPVEEL